MEKQYNVAIFFDNLKSHVSHIRRICNGCITSIHVGGVSDAPIIPFTNQKFRQYWEQSEFRYNTYLKYSRKLNPDGDTYAPLSGIKQDDVDAFNSWLRVTKGSRGLFIDWDRTITIFEGIVVGYTRDKEIQFDELFPGVTVEDTLLYLCGGTKRLQMVRDMLNTALSNNVDTYILTNNTACSYQFFKDIVDGLIGYNKLQIICSGDAPYYGNKAKAIRKYITNYNVNSHGHTRKRYNKSSRRNINEQLMGGSRRRRNTKRR